MSSYSRRSAVAFFSGFFWFPTLISWACTIAIVVDSIPRKNLHGSNLLSDVQRPIVISDAVPLLERRQWWKHIQTRSKNELVQVDRQNTPDVLEQQLIHALELVENVMDSNEPILVSSIGSSCSIDQLAVYDLCQSFFCDPDILTHFAAYTPMHDHLVISCNNAKSMLCTKSYTSIILSLGGDNVDYWLVPQTLQNRKAYHGYRAVTRTWEGDSFSLGWNSEKNIIESKDDVAKICLRPGDILVVPQRWWFQSHANGRSANISIHSKRCSSSGLFDLVRDVLATEDIVPLSGNDEDHAKVQKLFDDIKNL